MIRRRRVYVRARWWLTAVRGCRELGWWAWSGGRVGKVRQARDGQARCRANGPLLQFPVEMVGRGAVIAVVTVLQDAAVHPRHIVPVQRG